MRAQIRALRAARSAGSDAIARRVARSVARNSGFDGGAGTDPSLPRCVPSDAMSEPQFDANDAKHFRQSGKAHRSKPAYLRHDARPAFSNKHGFSLQFPPQSAMSHRPPLAGAGEDRTC